MKDANLTSPTDRNLPYKFEELRQRAFQDALSGLLNRATMEQSIKKRLEEMRPEDTCALFIIDMDDFKLVNDNLGHQAGDRAIRQSARILSGIFRASDVVGRLGGDEFAVFLSGDITEELIKSKAAEICETLQIVLESRPVINLTASVGICMSDGSQSFEDMYQAADLALYKAKKSGKSGYYIQFGGRFQPERNDAFTPVNIIPFSDMLEYMDSGAVLLEMGEYPQIIYVSPSFCRLIGVDLQEYTLPKALSDLIHPDDLASLEQSLKEGFEKEQAVENICRLLLNDGCSWLWCRIRAVRINGGASDPAMLITVTDISQFKENESRLKDINQRLQAAFEQTAQHIWEVDIASKNFVVYERGGKSYNTQYGEIKFPDTLIDEGGVHPSSAECFRAFAKELLGGQSQGYGNFILKHCESGCYGWTAVSYRMIFDDTGRAVRAVGIMEDLPKSFSGQYYGNVLRQPLPEAMISDLMVSMRANLTQNVVESLWAEGKNLSNQVWKVSCSQILIQEKEKILYGSSPESFLEYFERGRLLELFQNGERWISAVCRRADGGGNIRWVRHVIHLTENVKNHDVYLYIYLIRLDHRRIWEQTLDRQAGHDPVTQLYDRVTAEKMGETLFKEQDSGECAAAVFRADGLSDSTPGISEPAHDRLRRDIAAALSLALGGNCILGQYSSNEILILFPYVVSRENLRRRIEEAVIFVRQTLSGIISLSAVRFVAGAAVEPAETADYKVLLNKALHVCGMWWNAPSDTVVFFHEDEEWNWEQLKDDGQNDKIAVYSDEMKRPLSDGEKDVAFSCVSEMLYADSLESSVQGVLRTLGNYYSADRAYILMLAENRRVVTMPYEWTRPNKCSIQQIVSGMMLERFPLLERCLAERAPVFLTRTHQMSVKGGLSEKQPWCYTSFPLIRDGEIEGFLCIENSREHSSDAALFTTLIPYMIKERERFNGADHRAGDAEQLMGLPDLRSYMKIINTLNSEKYSSLGAVCLDIPAMASINGSLGFEYGSKLLWYVSKTLTELFGSSLLFRTWEAEFVVFCPNTTQQVFIGKYSRLRSILKRRYPRDIRMGRAWSGGKFSGKILAEEARYNMRNNLQQASVPMDLQSGNKNYSSIGEAVNMGRITVYFQPKINMQTGVLFGAEALARGIDDNGSIVSPARFIKHLEESGLIRELDFFVLDRVLSRLDQWQKSGYEIFPVSINFSRITLMHPSALASVLAIQSRYPNLPADVIEIEITESAGGMEIAELKNVVERFRSCGIKLTLDDFGSQYANLPLFTNVKFDAVKLDRSLVTELAGNPINQMLIQDIIQISKVCGMACIAEGVETQEQITQLLKAGCVYAQGYYYDRPMPMEHFEMKYLRGDCPAGLKPEGEY